jgi:protein-tyrosine phosphatase
VIDLHFHALPGVDDGPADETEALAMLVAAARSGTHIVVATPHRSLRWPTAPETIARGVRRMSELLEREGVELRLLAGAEVTIEQAAHLDNASLSDLSLGGGPYVLVESPYGLVGLELERTLARLDERGYGVVLAHPERCPAFLDRPKRLRAIVDGGVLCSVTAGALTGRFGEAPRWFGLELLRDGLAHSVDSDAHDARSRPPGLRAGLAAAADRLPAFERLGSWLSDAAPAAMLAGEPLPPRPV